jgi:hypothetical protein
MSTIDADGLIQTVAGEQRNYVRHPDEEADEDFEDEDDAFADEDDAEHALPYDEDDREDEAEYATEAAAQKDKADFDDFMSRIKPNNNATSSKQAIQEEDEGAEEIDTGAKKCCDHDH